MISEVQGFRRDESVFRRRPVALRLPWQDLGLNVFELAKLRYRAFGVSERHARYLQRGQYIDVLTTGRVQCQRGVDDIGVAGDTGAKTLSRLIDFLLGQAQALA